MLEYRPERALLLPQYLMKVTSRRNKLEFQRLERLGPFDFVQPNVPVQARAASSRRLQPVVRLRCPHTEPRTTASEETVSIKVATALPN
jgi:hypothetical protein